MKYKLDVIKNQRFEIGRTINPFLCDCEKCNFLHCPKNNYAVKTKPHKYTVKEFCEEWHDELIKRVKNRTVFDITYAMFCDLVGECISFPKGTYWGLGWCRMEAKNFDESVYDGITIVNIVRGKEVERAHISQFGEISDFGMSESQWKLAERISKAITQVREYAVKEITEGV